MFYSELVTLKRCLELAAEELQGKNRLFLLRPENQRSSRGTTWKTGTKGGEGAFKMKLTFSFSFFSLQWHMGRVLPLREEAACACCTSSTCTQALLSPFSPGRFFFAFLGQGSPPHLRLLVVGLSAVQRSGPLGRSPFQGSPVGRRPFRQPGPAWQSSRGRGQSFQGGGQFFKSC